MLLALSIGKPDTAGERLASLGNPVAQFALVVLELDFCVPERVGARAALNDADEMDELRQRGVRAGKHNRSRRRRESGRDRAPVRRRRRAAYASDVRVCSIGYDELIAVLLLRQQREHAVQPAPGLWNGRRAQVGARRAVASAMCNCRSTARTRKMSYPGLRSGGAREGAHGEGGRGLRVEQNGCGTRGCSPARPDCQQKAPTTLANVFDGPEVGSCSRFQEGRFSGCRS
jgi:hypothetical protein